MASPGIEPGTYGYEVHPLIRSAKRSRRTCVAGACALSYLGGHLTRLEPQQSSNRGLQVDKVVVASGAGAWT